MKKEVGRGQALILILEPLEHILGNNFPLRPCRIEHILLLLNLASAEKYSRWLNAEKVEKFEGKTREGDILKQVRKAK